MCSDKRASTWFRKMLWGRLNFSCFSVLIEQRIFSKLDLSGEKKTLGVFAIFAKLELMEFMSSVSEKNLKPRSFGFYCCYVFVFKANIELDGPGELQKNAERFWRASSGLETFPSNLEMVESGCKSLQRTRFTQCSCATWTYSVHQYESQLVLVFLSDDNWRIVNESIYKWAPEINSICTTKQILNISFLQRLSMKSFTASLPIVFDMQLS